MVAHGSTLLVQLSDRLFEAIKCLVIVEFTLNEANALGELLPDFLAELGAGILLNRVVHNLCKVFVFPVAAGKAHQCEAGRKQTTVSEVIDRRHELLTCQVASHTEQHQATGACDAVQSTVFGNAERVVLRSDVNR